MGFLLYYNNFISPKLKERFGWCWWCAFPKIYLFITPLRGDSSGTVHVASKSPFQCRAQLLCSWKFYFRFKAITETSSHGHWVFLCCRSAFVCPVHFHYACCLTRIGITGTVPGYYHSFPETFRYTLLRNSLSIHNNEKYFKWSCIE
jgi:hypothetical protein